MSNKEDKYDKWGPAFGILFILMWIIVPLIWIVRGGWKLILIGLGILLVLLLLSPHEE